MTVGAHSTRYWFCAICVPCARLWAKLRAGGFGSSWLRAVQALYADVPMSVRTSEGLSPSFQARLGLKQGCPLSPTLFGLYIDDFETEVMAAAQRGEQLSLPQLVSGSPMLHCRMRMTWCCWQLQLRGCSGSLTCCSNSASSGA